ncbi:MAG: response regulator [Bacteriovoracaceae bacterium]|nr:response regulator [Bacteriovoracaceae bacterium]
MSSYQILLVDDESDIRECVEIIARDSEFVFEHAPNGAEGLRKAINKNYDCIVSDIKMPQMTGPEMLKKLRAAGKHTPIVFISGFASDEFAHEVSNYGAVKLLNKIEIMKIKERILEAIELATGVKAILDTQDEMGEDFLNLVNKTG